MKTDVVHIIGARPNIPKFIPLYRTLESNNFRQSVIHTGQHYSSELTTQIFKDLGFNPSKIKVNLNIGSGSHSSQVSKIIGKLEAKLITLKPNLVVVYGDVNSSFAAAVATKHLGIDLVHIESGLRSFDTEMIEEFNRVQIDHSSNYLFCTLMSSVLNLKNEGISGKKVFLVGNTMIDSLKYVQNKFDLNKIAAKLVGNNSKFVFLTLHRPSNTENSKRWFSIKKAINNLNKEIPVVVSAHPRSKSLFEDIKYVKVLNSPGYKESISLQNSAEFVVTDSGGLQEETTFLKIPCLTLRKNTERPETVKIGTNKLIEPEDLTNYQYLLTSIKKRDSKKQIKFWDGNAALRVANQLSTLT
jgi:UDP-N-acetylglucosamine 2-epimerase (non-hydrolysing)